MSFQRSGFAIGFYLRFLCAATISLAGRTGCAQLQAIDLQGHAVDFAQYASRSVNVVIFVRSDCPISNRYAPTLQKLSSQYADKVGFWLVYPDKSETPAGIERHIRDYNYKGIFALRDPQHALVKAAHAEITPEAAVFDTNAHRLLYHGRIDNWYQSAGHMRAQPTTHELEDAIRAALDGKPVPIPETKAVGCYIADLQ